MGKDNNIYLKDDAELEQFRAEHKNKKYEVKRFKGLGEMDSEETLVLTEEDKRTLCQITIDDIAKTNELFDDLMGTAVLPRKNFIKEHSKEATYNAE